MKLSEEEIDNIFTECFNELRRNECNDFTHVLIKIFKSICYIIFISFVIYTILYHHQPTLSLVMRNVQGFIYPGLKILRLLSVPIISAYPSLSELYDESCLVQNPYFIVPDMDCYPCENVYSVIDLTGFTNISLYQSGIPYIIKTDLEPVNISTLQDLYIKYKSTFDQDAKRIYSRNQSLRTIEDSLTNELHETEHILWRINRMTPARILRTVFPKPYTISQWSGQSPERYIIIDGENSEPYYIPDMECSYVYTIQGSGRRTILLRPSKECLGLCRTVSVVLNPSEVLFYNWWYWRPISVPFASSKEKSVTYIGSYC
ncbi:uncharacterized protein LOC123292893 [Chrysoperla carnea]|uniref:uncharacterized protein LOC123292893 n=1 Tax=Chrysoperla carnea TaxID=189513 RepID=UPI001D08EE8E|nr:uncharacterized protein LOC123292893 [Chrysoperla carnea]